ncbi:MAG: hypothetical protein OCC46_09170 [Pseudodesulfovibrio sp.]
MSNINEFHCPICGVYAKRSCHSTYTACGDEVTPTLVKICRCEHCSEQSYWIEEKMVYPSPMSLWNPHPDMPADCMAEYQVAKQQFKTSPESAASILRGLCRRLLVRFVSDGVDIDVAMSALAKSGFPPKLMKLLEFFQIVGADAVGFDKLNSKDDLDIALQLSGLIHIIVGCVITQEENLKSMYSMMPQSFLNQMEERGLEPAAVVSQALTNGECNNPAEMTARKLGDL